MKGLKTISDLTAKEEAGTVDATLLATRVPKALSDKIASIAKATGQTKRDVVEALLHEGIEVFDRVRKGKAAA